MARHKTKLHKILSQNFALPISSGAVCIPITSKKLSRMSLREVCSEKLICKEEKKKRRRESSVEHK
jgi:hypothetical protein